MSVVLIRSLILYIVVIFGVRLMGKRQLGELQPSELVITILISNIATLPAGGYQHSPDTGDPADPDAGLLRSVDVVGDAEIPANASHHFRQTKNRGAGRADRTGDHAGSAAVGR